IMKCVWMCALFLFTLIHGGWTIGDQRCSNEPHCRLDPEVNMNITQIIRRWGYPAEEHEVVTEDGYILTVNRIPHGLRHSAGGFLILFQFFVVVFTYTSTLIKISESVLWEKKYSTIHPIPEQSECDRPLCSCSYDEMALKDLPAVINHVLKVTGQEKIFYIGHSQGTTIAFIAFSTLPELASKIRLFLGLAPVATVAFTCSPVTKLSKLPECLIRGLFGKRDFLPQSRYIKWLAEHVCAKKCLDELCGNLFFVICGYDKKNLNMTRIPVYTTHSPAGTSVQNMIHWAQMIVLPLFSNFDLLSLFTFPLQSTPPEFRVKDMKVPTALFSGGHDTLADPKDMAVLLTQVSNLVYHQHIEHWEHLDFIWGMDAPQVMFPSILKLLQQHQ
uniref:Lipase n=1 Tax=Cyprinodon variegatus TaxID=28743 RepID=A0A3Q2GB36_CYPVA